MTEIINFTEYKLYFNKITGNIFVIWTLEIEISENPYTYLLN